MRFKIAYATSFVHLKVKKKLLRSFENLFASFIRPRYIFLIYPNLMFATALNITWLFVADFKVIQIYEHSMIFCDVSNFLF